MPLSQINLGRSLFILVSAGSVLAVAQDTRSVAEPIVPTVCSVIRAPLRATPDGPLVGPSVREQDVESSSESITIATALNNCSKGHAVELALGQDPSYDAFLIDPIVFPSDVSLIIDGGVTVFGTRDPARYQDTNPKSNPKNIRCGTVGTFPAVTGCTALFQVTDNDAIYGYGVIDGQGNMPLLTGPNAGSTWWDLTFSKVGTTNEQSAPWLISSGKLYGLHANNFILDKITLRSPPFHTVKWFGDGLTVWDVKIQAPWNVGNTDGFDLAGRNMTIYDTTVANGDDDIAFGVNADPTQNVTVNHFRMYGRGGITILGNGQSKWPISGFLIENVAMTGDLPSVRGTTVNGIPESLLKTDKYHSLKSYAQALPNSTGNIDGLNIKPTYSSAAASGPVITNIVYRDICMQDVEKPMTIQPQAPFAGNYPTVSNIRYENVHIAKPTSQFVKVGAGIPSGAGSYQLNFLAGAPSFLNSFTFDNVVFDDASSDNSSLAKVTAKGNNITTETNVYPAALNDLQATDPAQRTDLNTMLVLASNSYISSDQTSSEWLAQACHQMPFVEGELYLSEQRSTGAGGLVAVQQATVAAGSSVTLNAVVQPVMSQVTYFGPKIYGSDPGLLAIASPSLTNDIVFYDGFTPIGTAQLAANGTLATFVVNNIRPGTHIYRAEYPADQYYASLPFGLVTVQAQPSHP